MAEYLNKVYFSNAQRMKELPDNTVSLIVTSPPYFNIKDYSKDGRQIKEHSEKNADQIGDIQQYQKFISSLLKVWKECERVLEPNGKLVINTPLMPMKKADYNTHFNRHIFDLNSDIQHSIIYRKKTQMFLFDTYIWNRKNGTKKLMFGSYPYPRNFYAQNTSEFITVFVKDGHSKQVTDKSRKEKSKLSQSEWIELTKQIWTIAIPNKKDLAFGDHSAIMPEEIVERCVKLFSFVDDIVLDPFAGSGTTLKVAYELGRNYVGYEIMDSYSDIIDIKMREAEKKRHKNGF
jgi:site-specific DNA-methyltransferase (cytosine-N4-specific)